MPNPEPPAQPPREASGAPPGAGATVTSRELLGESGVLRIRHGPETYVLRRTRTGKLILTK